MGYFSNATEHEIYWENYCIRCVHNDKETSGCPVMDLHWLWNYDAVGTNKDRDKEFALNTLIPRGDVFNEKCAMFYELGEGGDDVSDNGTPTNN